ncbi:multidrug resistance-associated ABC transporter [Lentinula detonsa]|uniref:Multidrug resistance-associated ABC transporter n=1 Tax=Lentinula detonsa TaxID=2804962 RepID=A0AA38PX67_9AGAR|nr:multidrug resistance-associated ABC transporter [Lentinula detonsa]
MKLYNPLHPPPAPPAFGRDTVLPEPKASLLSRLVFQWLSPFLAVGFSRPLEKDDLWQLPSTRLTANVTDRIETNFFQRCPPDQRPRHLRQKLRQPWEADPVDTLRQYSDDDSMNTEKVDKGSSDTKTNDEKKTSSRMFRKSENSKPEYDSSLLQAIYQTFKAEWWTSGMLKLVSDTLKTTTPLVNKVILTWLTDSFVYYKATPSERTELGLTSAPRGIGYGIGLAFALFVMQESASLMTNHYMQISMANGLAIRTGIIGNIFRKSLRLSGRARNQHSVGQITTMISTDATRLDTFSANVHNLWVSPIQIAIGIGLLIANLGYSALVGLGVLLLGFPLQILCLRIMFTNRRKGVKVTDSRVRLTTEVLQGIRLIKSYAWEGFYVSQIYNFRKQEVARIRTASIARAALIALVTFIPVLASVLSFITYALSGHDLNVAIIFSSLQFFNIIRAPLLFFPIVLSALSDFLVAMGRIGKFLKAEELAEPYTIDLERKNAVEVDGDFSWETAGKIAEPKFEKGGKSGPAIKNQASADGDKSKENGKAQKGLKSNGDQGLPLTAQDVGKATESEMAATPKEEEEPFALRNLKFDVPKGSFVAIVGTVGSGKSSILNALIGEMRRTRGDVVFGGSVSYVPQTPWIRNATLKENVLFGMEENEKKFKEVMRACNLEHDLELLPHGEYTEIGEKGINLSGGQKARVSLARAAYSDSDIVLLDDPLSAVDSYVGKSILTDCFLNGPLADKTRILVTHALHVLDKTDYIFVVDQGEIKERGTFQTLMSSNGLFTRIMDEYGSLDHEEESTCEKEETDDEVVNPSSVDKAANAALMQTEERNVGAVGYQTYAKYLKFAGGIWWAPFILLLLTLTQGAQVGNNLFLGFWTAESIPGFGQSQYMGVYAALGFAQALFTFLLSFSFAIAGLVASLNLFQTALRHVLRSPISFFDTTPMGRILSRLSKDQDTLDTTLTTTLMQFLNTFSSVLGTVALVFYTFPLLGIIFAPMTIFYYFISIYYRRSSVETKRLDSLMRSALYSSYSETLTGLSTIRAYREQMLQARSVVDAQNGLDLENRAYYMTISIQRWLSIRLDLLGNILILGIALFAAGFRATVNPSKIGVVLSYTLSITQIFSEMVSQYAQSEQNMNAVERILVYAELPSEGDAVTPRDPPPTWPASGRIEFRNVQLAYRKGLPLVLNGVSFNVHPGEKARWDSWKDRCWYDDGKSSLIQALLRMVELEGGKIDIDGFNTRDIGLDVLRGKLALVPQDSVLFLGTLRENLDPMSTRTDAELISALQRAWLLPRDGTKDPVAEAKFSLDATVGDEGSNFSAGEKQLVALCRALVKNSRIIILDEATSNVDVETDAKLQRTIQTEFSTSTLLCIAHRLNTIAYYDRIIVMDAGQVAEFDTVLNLFDREDSIFRSLCNEANLQRSDILRIRASYGDATPVELASTLKAEELNYESYN